MPAEAKMVQYEHDGEPDAPMVKSQVVLRTKWLEAEEELSSDTGLSFVTRGSGRGKSKKGSGKDKVKGIDKDNVKGSGRGKSKGSGKDNVKGFDKGKGKAGNNTKGSGKGKGKGKGSGAGPGGK